MQVSGFRFQVPKKKRGSFGFAWHLAPGTSSLRASRGFTLIELLLYTGILIILVSVIGSTLLAFSRTYRSIASEQAIEQGAEGGLERMVRDIHSASTIDTANSMFDTSPGALSLNATDAAGTPVTIRLSLSNGILHLSKDGVDEGPLMPASVNVSSLIFRSITTANSQAVKIEMTLESGTSSSYHARSFYETTVLRGTYVQ